MWTKPVSVERRRHTTRGRCLQIIQTSTSEHANTAHAQPANRRTNVIDEFLLSVVEVNNVSGDGVEEGTIMRHNHNSAFILLQIRLRARSKGNRLWTSERSHINRKSTNSGTASSAAAAKNAHERKPPVQNAQDTKQATLGREEESLRLPILTSSQRTASRSR